jgi:hypothetical protein
MLASKGGAIRIAPSYYFTFDHPQTARVGDTFIATLSAVYNRGDFASDQTLAPHLEAPGSTTMVPLCSFDLAAALMSPNLTVKPLVANKFRIASAVQPATVIPRWSWLVVGDTVGEHYLDFSTTLTVADGPRGLCKRRQILPISATARLVQVTGGFNSGELAVTNLIAIISGALGVLSAIIGLRKRST